MSTKKSKSTSHHLSLRTGGVVVVIGVVLLALLYTFYSGWVAREWLRTTTQFDSPEPTYQN